MQGIGVFLSVILISVSVNLKAQTPEHIFRQSVDSLEKKSILNYIIFTAHDKPKHSDSISVVIEQGAQLAEDFPFIIQGDSLELIFDGRYSFMVNHRQKNVRQISKETLLENRMTGSSLVSVMINYRTMLTYLDKKKITKENGYWRLRFRNTGTACVYEIAIDKVTMLPTVIYLQRAGAKTKICNLTYPRVVTTVRPGIQIARYIDTYTLLPLDANVLPRILDGRDSLVGQLAPDFILQDLNNVSVRLTDFRGRYVLLDFWELWCAPCRMSMPHLQALHRKYLEKGLIIIGITKDNPVLAAKLVRDKGLEYINLRGNEKVSLAYRINEIPQYYLIDKNGVLIYASKNGFEKEIENILEKKLE